MRKIIFAAIVLLLLFSMAGWSATSAPEPERCSLCDYIPSHAPCLVNLNTGEVGEIIIYDPHPTLVGEIGEVQRGGYFSFRTVAGLKGYIDACASEAHITVPEEVEKYEEKHFCSTCRELLEAHSKCGFILADLRNPEAPMIYAVLAGTEFEVRCYKVSVTMKEDNELDVSVIGSIQTAG